MTTGQASTLAVWRWRLRYGMSKQRERAAIAVADRLPRWLVYRATIRCGVHATSGRYSTQEVPALTLTDALQRWQRDHD